MKNSSANILPRSIAIVFMLLIGIYLITPTISIQVNRGLSMLSFHDVKGLTMQLGSLGNQAALLSVILSVLQILYAPLPFATLLTATVTTFGSAAGLFICWLGVLLGSAGAYGIARAFFKPVIDKFFAKRFHLQVNNSVQFYQILLLIAAWLIPAWTAELVAYLAGFSNLSFKYFIAATAIGIIPNLWLTARWGEMLLGPIIYALCLVSLLCVITVTVRAIFRKEIRL